MATAADWNYNWINLGDASTVWERLVSGRLVISLHSQQATGQVQSRSAVEERALRLSFYLSIGAFVWAIGIAIIGALVGATGAAESCNGWPLCDGKIIPASTEHSLMIGHRFGSFAILLLSAALVCITRIRLERYTGIIALASTAFALILLQSVVGGAAVVRNLPGLLASLHLLLALIVAGTLSATAVVLHRELTASGPDIAVKAGASGIVRGIVAVTPLTVILAGYVNPRDLNSLSFGQPGGIEAALLVSAAIVAVLVALMNVGMPSREVPNSRSRTIVVFSSLALAISGGLGLLPAFVETPVVIPALALGLAAAGWSGFVALAYGTNLALETPPLTIPSVPRLRELVRDFLRVMKPGIMVLLLVTTLGAMLIASNGWPPLGLVLITMFGGALASGGASALNCYHDRDIDGVMARTRKRPIPTGGLTPHQVRAWGYILSGASVMVLAIWANPLAALMALSGNIFYVEIYTRRLKRSTPQNIVIGGAAGSFPPLVGWAAASGSLSLGAFLIAALVFYWTPPHFWSLALLKANDYRRAGIPMLPVTHGDHETRRRIVLYALLLVAITLLMVPAGVAGWLYGAVAAVLGARFVMVAFRMFREDTNRLAWPLFKYSNYYLAALLAAMVIDHAVRQFI